MRLCLWSPLPPSTSGIADYVAEQLPALSRRFDLTVVVEDPTAVAADLARTYRVVGRERAGEADLDLYQVGNSPAHAFVYRAALKRPGVVLLHDWSLHHLVLRETVERGDVSAYLREMRRAYGETGTFVGRQVARALGGELLPALFPLNDRLLEASLAVVGLTEWVCSRAALRLPGRPVLRLPHHVSLPLDPLPSREEARQALGLPGDAFLVTAPGLATAAKGLDRALRVMARLRSGHPGVRLVVAGGLDPRLDLVGWPRAAGVEERLLVTGRLSLGDFIRHLCAADVVLALRFPSHGEISGALVRALGVGRPTLVTAGTPAAEEFPPGVVVPVDPGPREEAELLAFLGALASHPSLGQAIGQRARDHVRRLHDLDATVGALGAFLEGVARDQPRLRAALAEEGGEEAGLLGYLLEEMRWGARDLGLPLDPAARTLVAQLLGKPA
ncbi:MAG TPA: glycosyltransferase family 4 protein [Vicinamibacteria bacterium]|nr:glycosyltransferase family 4 protein [Vicinamibacteria bacterium]